MKTLCGKKRNLVFLIIGLTILITVIFTLVVWLSINNKSVYKEAKISCSYSNLDIANTILSDDNNDSSRKLDFSGTENECYKVQEDNDISSTTQSQINGNNFNTCCLNCESEHIHSLLPYYNNRQIQVGTQYIIDQAAIYKSVTCCNVCGAKDVVYGIHQCNDGCFSSHTERIVVSPEIGHYDPIYNSEQYIEYYYCSECGVRQ